MEGRVHPFLRLWTKFFNISKRLRIFSWKFDNINKIFFERFWHSPSWKSHFDICPCANFNFWVSFIICWPISQGKNQGFHFFNFLTSKLNWGWDWTSKADQWRHQLYHVSLSENGFWPVNYTLIMWPNWLRHLLSPLVKDYDWSNFQLIPYMDARIPGCEIPLYLMSFFFTLIKAFYICNNI